MDSLKFFDLLADLAAVVGAVVTVFVFRHGVKRERKILTIDEYSRIRSDHSGIVTDDEKLDYLKDMEFFCVGINSGIYDFKILQKMSGRRLLSLYQDEMKDFIIYRRESQNEKDAWCEYETVMRCLECHYCSSKGRFRKFFCKKRLGR